MKKSTITTLAVVLFLTIGFAAKSTVLDLVGTLAVGEGELTIKFNRVSINGNNRPSIISRNEKSLLFTTADILDVGDSLLSYEVVNTSSQYDAKIDVTCTTDAGYVTLESQIDNPIVQAGKSGSGKILISSTGKKEEENTTPSGTPLYDIVKNQSLGLDTTVGLNYGTNANDSNEQGVYETTKTDNGRPVYFYRGDVKNNFIVYANACWSIVRTTETGGVKLLYAGLYANGSCDQMQFSVGGTPVVSSNTFYHVPEDVPYSYNAHIGYMYGDSYATTYEKTHENINDSNLKKEADSWYEENILGTNYENMLEDTVWCNDRSVNFGTGVGNVATTYAAYNRINESTSSPTLKCSQTNDRFTVNIENGNGSLKYPIATLTADELVLAGLSLRNPTENNYLNVGDKYNITYPFWTLTPYRYRSSWTYHYLIEANTEVTIANFTTSDKSVTRRGHLRPSVSLKAGTNVVSGDGTINNPYLLYKEVTTSERITCTLMPTPIERTELAPPYKGIRSLYDTVKISSLGTKEANQLNYDKISSDTNGRGVYETNDTDSNTTVYFYRGNVEDNNVIYAGHCWQIMRTTETGGTKMIYNGKIREDGSCNNTGEEKTIGTSVWSSSGGDNAYLGYKIGNLNATTYANAHSNSTDSEVKKVIDEWYEKNILGKDEENLLEDTVYCNDRSVLSDYSNLTGFATSSYNTKGYGTNYTLYTGTARAGVPAIETTPTLKCSNKNDRYTVNSTTGNGELTYPIGLPTIDEMVFAGATGGFGKKANSSLNTEFYLYVGGKHFWTMTPHRNHGSSLSILLIFGADGNIGNEVTTNAIYVRPVLSIKSGTMIKNGNGTMNNPFQLEESK